MINIDTLPEGGFPEGGGRLYNFLSETFEYEMQLPFSDGAGGFLDGWWVDMTRRFEIKWGEQIS